MIRRLNSKAVEILYAEVVAIIIGVADGIVTIVVNVWMLLICESRDSLDLSQFAGLVVKRHMMSVVKSSAKSDLIILTPTFYDSSSSEGSPRY